MKVYHKDGKKSIKGEVAGRDSWGSVFNRRGREERKGIGFVYIPLNLHLRLVHNVSIELDVRFYSVIKSSKNAITNSSKEYILGIAKNVFLGISFTFS